MAPDNTVAGLTLLPQLIAGNNLLADYGTQEDIIKMFDHISLLIEKVPSS